MKYPENSEVGNIELIIRDSLAFAWGKGIENEGKKGMIGEIEARECTNDFAQTMNDP